MTQEYVGIKFCEKDEVMVQAIRESFPDCFTMRSDELEGGEIFFVVIIPLASFALQLLDFVLKYFTSSKTPHTPADDAHIQSKRSLVVDGKTVSADELTNMTKPELKKHFSLKLNVDFEIGVD